MTHRRRAVRLAAWLLWLPLATPVPAALGQADPIVARGIAYLRAARRRSVRGGGVRPRGAGDDQGRRAQHRRSPHGDDQHPAWAIQPGRATAPKKGSGAEIYEAGVIILALANHDPVAHRRRDRGRGAVPDGQAKAPTARGTIPGGGGRHVDLAVRRPRLLGGRERGGQRRAVDLGPGRELVPVLAKGRGELDLSPRRAAAARPSP